MLSFLARKVEPRYNEPLYNEVLGITNDFLYPSTVEPRYNKPLYNEVLGITKSKTANYSGTSI